MKKMRVVFSALVGTLLVVGTGCNPECVDQYDCANHKGNAPDGQQWTCMANKCVATPVATTPGTDAGTKPDAGTGGGTDAGTGGGTDAGTGGGTDAGTDAGTPPADMTIAEGAACTTTASCMAGLYCDGPSKKCAPLQLVVTTSAPSQDAVIVPYKAPGTGGTPAGTTSFTRLSEITGTGSKVRFPRWSKDGTTVAFVEDDGTNVTLVSRTLPLTGGQKSTLITGTAASTTDFRYMEWEPGTSVLWTTKTASSTSGINGVAPGGALTNYVTAGVFPAWSADGTSFAYSANTLGLKVRSVSAGTDGTVPGVTSASAEQPLYNKANSTVLFLDAKGNTATIGGSATPLTELYVSTTPGTPLAAATSGGTSTSVNSFVANHTWSPLGTHVAYVRVYYSGGAICAGGSTCGGTNGNVIFVQRLNADGTANGTEIQFATEATLPSFSPDGRFIAYLSGSKLKVQQIDPAGTDAASLKVGTLISHEWGSTYKVESSFSDDDRPRWQPR